MSNPESHGVEDYLEAIYELQEEGDRVVQAQISRRLGVTRASVSEQVARLQKMRLGIVLRAGDGDEDEERYSHSMVPGGFDVMS